MPQGLKIKGGAWICKHSWSHRQQLKCLHCILAQISCANCSFILAWAPVIVFSTRGGGRNYLRIEQRQHIAKSCNIFIMGWGATINCHVTEFTQYTCWPVDLVVTKVIVITTLFSEQQPFVKMVNFNAVILFYFFVFALTVFWFFFIDSAFSATIMFACF